ncbi:hypothetical protein BN14_01272 [Rhizoctonia solani AG-1 IB]|uniref:Uncharacterized protein n=1 Tax=Thanatephorus cucumeris (strain AG1-IB / isolate 7/3/14) TaxID=1108050 RepID=M5BKJ4_THACB|nr:hypothetical protein BN14_01272 [Rhizoctonia solani AG-1 IB]
MGARSEGKLRAQSSSDDESEESDESDVGEDIIYHVPNSDDDMLGEKAKTCMIGVAMPGLRVHVPSKSKRQRLEVKFPQCTCMNPESGDCVACRIPPCVFKVMRSLQAQQLIHSDEIMALQGNMCALGI